jgi:hypothetical protein
MQDSTNAMRRLSELVEQRAKRSRSRYASFDEFWIAYLRAHSNPKVAGFHVLGTALSVAAFAAIVGCGMVFFAAFAAVPAQLFAAIGHWLVAEPDDVSPHRPDWAAVANLRLLWLALGGRLDDTVREAMALQRGGATSQ